MNAKALTALTEAIREHGSPAARETLGWTLLDFLGAWADELADLDEFGECEIGARHTWDGHPVRVYASECKFADCDADNCKIPCCFS